MQKVALIFLLVFTNLTFSQKRFTKVTKLMGSRYDITVIAKDSVQANKYIQLAINEIKRIEKSISSWKTDSETALINNNAGVKPVKVSKELFDLIKRSKIISKLTDGAFDISYASMDKIWKFDGSMKSFPSKEKIKKSVAKVGYRNIILNEKDTTVFLKLKGMKIGFGGVGKGYSADKAKQLLMRKGVKAGIINASGDMNTWGKQPNGKDWYVAITNPFNKNKAFALLPLKQGAVVTSGNYEKYVMFNGKRYTHIINPKTGYPSSGIVSVTVFAPKAEMADALATSVFVMGKDVGLNRINQLPKTECIIIDDKGKIITSKNIKIENYVP
jgi:thiamine biosynthesis lipoprotein